MLRFERSRCPDPAVHDGPISALGGTIEILLDGSEGYGLLDSVTIDASGYLYLTDGGHGADLSRIYRYDATLDALTVLAQADPTLFDPNAGSPAFLTDLEMLGGITDASSAFGPGWFVFALSDSSQQAAQLLALYDPAAAP